MSDAALLSIDGPIATITLNRPEAFNSVNLAIAQKLEQLGAEVEANDAIKVLVIQGEGRAFSAGGDLQTIGAAAEADTIAPVVGELLKHYHAFIETVRRMPKIVLSSVHGSAAGAGMGLAFITDLCIATEDAKFTPAYAKIGVSPDGGSTVGMVGTVGVRRAFQIFLAEDSFTAQQAYEWGLVAKVVPAAELKAETKKFAERLARNPAGGDRRHQGAGLSGRDRLDQGAARCRGEEHHRLHAVGGFPRGGEEIHQQVEMSALVTPQRSFICLRHGATDWNRQGLFQGLTDNPLNDDGIAQAHAAAEKLRALEFAPHRLEPPAPRGADCRDHCQCRGQNRRRRSRPDRARLRQL